MRVLYCGCALYVYSLSGKTDRETVRENKGYYGGSAVGFVSSFLLDNRKEGLDVRGGRSPNWVNHVYLCLSGFYVFCVLVFFHIFYVLHCSIIYNFLTTGLRKRNILLFLTVYMHAD